MTQVASPETVVADFNNATVVDVHGRPMTLERRGAEFWATFDDPDGVNSSPTIATRSGAGGTNGPFARLNLMRAPARQALAGPRVRASRDRS